MGAKTHQWRRRFQRSKWNRQRQTKSASSYLGRSTSPPQHFSIASPCYLVNSLPLLPLALFYTSLYMSVIQLHDQVTKTNTNSYMISAFLSSRANSTSIFFLIGVAKEHYDVHLWDNIPFSCIRSPSFRKIDDLETFVSFSIQLSDIVIGISSFAFKLASRICKFPR